jgi:hypothetical protein
MGDGWQGKVQHDRYKGTGYTEYQAFFPVVQIGSPPPPHPPGIVLFPPLDPRGETHSLAGEGVGEPNSDEGTDTLVLYAYFNPSTDQGV